MADRSCPGHTDLAEELRDYAGEALDLLQPWVDRVREQDVGADPEPAVCASCPVCAVITVLRGGRSELAVRLAEHAAGWLAVLRTALEEGAGTPSAPPRGTGPEPSNSGGAPPRSATEPRRSGGEPPRPATEARREAEPRSAPPRHRFSPRSGRTGRVVQRIEVTRDGRGRPRGEPFRGPC
jgi:hypothetical protein